MASTPPTLQRAAIGVVEKNYLNRATKDNPSLGNFEVVCITESNDKHVFTIDRPLATPIAVGDVGIIAVRNDTIFSFSRSKDFSV
jgi:hypothetical protein